MKLDLAVLASLEVALAPSSYVRLMPMVHAATPLGAGYGRTRFASTADAFKVIYLARNLSTAIAETIVRDRFQGRRRRRLLQSEVDLWGATAVSATRPLVFIDIRTSGLMRLGVSTNAARGKAQGQGRMLSQAVHDQTNADGLIYLSRLTAETCLCVYERGFPSLMASPVIEVARLADFVDGLKALDVTLIAAP